MKSIFRKLVPFVLIFTLVLSFTACGEKEKPEEAIDNLIAALKEMDMEKAQQYINTGSLPSVEGDESLPNGDVIIEQIFSRISHEIVSVENIENNAATVKTKITTPDLTAILWQCTMELTPQFAITEPSEEEQNEMITKAFMEAVGKDGQPTVTNEVDVTVKKIDGTWKVDVDDEFQNAISGGFFGALANARGSMFGAE